MTFSRRMRFVLFGGALLLIIFVGSFAGMITDWWWFQSVGHEQFFTTILGAKLVIALLFGLASYLFLALNISGMRVLGGSHPRIIRFAGQQRAAEIHIERIVARFGRAVAIAISGTIALSAAAQWDVILRFIYRMPFPSVDPVFHRNVAFYVFSVPFISLCLQLATVLVVTTFAAVVLGYIVKGMVAWQSEGGGLKDVLSIFRSFSSARLARIHLSFLFAFFMCIAAAKVYFVRMSGLVVSTTGPLVGAGYVDAHITKIVLFLLCGIAVFLAVACVAHAFRPMGRVLIAGAFLYGVVAIVGGGAVPFLVQKLVVQPNELVKESPYIKNHITATRAAFGIDAVEERELAGDAAPLTAADLAPYEPTIRNIRLWDREPLLETFSQLQEIRTYYEFGSVDNDRYIVNGEYRQVLLSPRELSTESLPVRNFINDHLTFTHGYGLTLGPVNEVTNEGLPVLFVKDLPPTTTVDSLSITRPEIYYGEQQSSYSVVRTRAKEFDYPSGDENIFTSYAGTGGVRVGSWFRKALFAARFGSLKILLSDDITGDSRFLYYRTLRERILRIAPFLRLDSDPYLVVTDKGRLVWIVDAYTTTDRYPYAALVTDRQSRDSMFPQRINYIRNSVKITIDAYDGTVQFFLSDPNDPIIQTFAALFPGAFLPIDALAPDLRRHIRYPEDLFAFQTRLFTAYHMDEPQIFYNQEDQWQIPDSPGRDDADPLMRHMIMQLPGETQEEFILMLPFTPRGKENLAAWMVARSDGEHYGQLVVYRFPKQKLVFGPNQIASRIDQDATISQELTLWDQRGSHVVRGNLLVIPIEQSLLYVQPIYLRADNGTIPELKRVIVAYENRIAMEETLDAALAKLFTGSGSAAIVPVPVSAPKGTDRAAQAKEYFENAVRAQRSGDWAAYGRNIELLGEVLEELAQ